MVVGAICGRHFQLFCRVPINGHKRLSIQFIFLKTWCFCWLPKSLECLSTLRAINITSSVSYNIDKLFLILPLWLNILLFQLYQSLELLLLKQVSLLCLWLINVSFSMSYPLITFIRIKKHLLLFICTRLNSWGHHHPFRKSFFNISYHSRTLILFFHSLKILLLLILKLFEVCFTVYVIIVYHENLFVIVNFEF